MPVTHVPHACLCVCLSVTPHISATTGPILMNFFLFDVKSDCIEAHVGLISKIDIDRSIKWIISIFGPFCEQMCRSTYLINQMSVELKLFLFESHWSTIDAPPFGFSKIDIGRSTWSTEDRLARKNRDFKSSVHGRYVCRSIAKSSP